MAKQLFAVYEEPENVDSKVAWQNFIEAVTSEETRYKYGYSFMTYLEFLKIRKDDLHILLKQNPKVIEANIISYIRKMRDERLAYSTMNVKLSAIVLFFTMNDIIVNRKKIGKFLGEHTKKVKDRAYTREEIKKIIDVSDRKYKVFVLLMASTGCRLGAIPPLKLKHLKYFEDYKLYQITFYEGTKYEYYSFCTPECTKYIDEYLDYRKRCGEKLNENSPLLRDDFILDDLLHIQHPRHLNNDTFKYTLRRILIEIGLRSVTSTIAESLDSNTKNKEIRKRKEIAQHHGFRKFTHTTMTNKKINPEVREMLLGHSIGLSGAYYRPSVSEMLNEYLKVVDALTINEENRLSKQVQELLTKNQDKDYVIKGKLREKDDEIKGMREQINEMNKKFEQVFSLIQQNPDLVQVKPEVLISKNKV